MKPSLSVYLFDDFSPVTITISTNETANKLEKHSLSAPCLGLLHLHAYTKKKKNHISITDDIRLFKRIYETTTCKQAMYKLAST